MSPLHQQRVVRFVQRMSQDLIPDASSVHKKELMRLRPACVMRTGYSTSQANPSLLSCYRKELFGHLGPEYLNGSFMPVFCAGEMKNILSIMIKAKFKTGLGQG